MKNSQPFGHISSLVFCRENVDPDFVTATLELEPTSSQKLGEPLRYSNGAEVSSHLGIWKLKLPGAVEADSVEDQIERWLELLKAKRSGLRRLRELDYAPYLDCPYRQSDLSVCIEPNQLKALGELEVSLSIWLYDPPGGNEHEAAVVDEA
jgi:hypothetical protein